MLVLSKLWAVVKHDLNYIHILFRERIIDVNQARISLRFLKVTSTTTFRIMNRAYEITKL
jgi:hypothetical protein